MEIKQELDPFAPTNDALSITNDLLNNDLDQTFGDTLNTFIDSDCMLNALFVDDEALNKFSCLPDDDTVTSFFDNMPLTDITTDDGVIKLDRPCTPVSKPEDPKPLTVTVVGNKRKSDPRFSSGQQHPGITTPMSSTATCSLIQRSSSYVPCTVAATSQYTTSSYDKSGSRIIGISGYRHSTPSYTAKSFTNTYSASSLNNQVKRVGPRNKPLNNLAVAIMEQWYSQNIDHPYPSIDEKQSLARRGLVTVAQVNSWFANRRNRSDNTRPKKNRKQLQIRIYQFSKELERLTRNAISAQQINNRLMQIIQEYSL